MEINGNLSPNVEVVFELHGGDWSYYMVDTDHCRLFWIDDFIVDESVLAPSFGIEHRKHLCKSFLLIPDLRFGIVAH